MYTDGKQGSVKRIGETNCPAFKCNWKQQKQSILSIALVHGSET